LDTIIRIKVLDNTFGETQMGVFQVRVDGKMFQRMFEIKFMVHRKIYFGPKVKVEKHLLERMKNMKPINKLDGRQEDLNALLPQQLHP